MLRIKSIVLFTVLALMVPVAVMAEGFSDLYIGFAQSQDQDLMVTSGATTSDEKAEFEGGISAGYRIGYWFETMPYVGLAMEISYFEQNIEDVADFKVIPISPLLMLRIPLLKSAEFPSGEWQPYAGVGPGFFMSKLKSKASNEKYDETDIGLDARCGLKKYLVPNFGLFLEYRYTQFSPEFEPAVKEFDMQTHHALFGITVNF